MQITVMQFPKIMWLCVMRPRDRPLYPGSPLLSGECRHQPGVWP